MNSKIKIITIALFLIFGLNIQAQNSLLWKISGNGLEKPSYLYGTIHLICESDMIRIADLNELVNKTEQVALEIDLDDPTLIQKMQMGSMNPGMKNISTELTEDQKTLIDNYLKKNIGSGLDQLGIMKPWVISVMISTHGVIDCPEKSGYEAKLIEFAQAGKKEIIGLESIESQLGLFEQFSKEEQINMMVEAVKEKAKYDDMLRKMLEQYKEQNVNELHDLVMNSSPEMHKYADLLLNNRNKDWVEKMPAIMKEKSTLFAVGAGHLGGDQGVITLLKKAGYTVEEVENDFYSYLKDITIEKAAPILINTIF